MKRKHVVTAFGASLVYFGLESLGGLVLIPTMARYLPVEDVGAWILFTAFIPLVPLSVSGFSPLVVREIAAAHAASDGDRIRALMVDARRRTYIAAAGLIVLLVASYAFFVHPVGNELHQNASLAWLLFCVALFARLDILRSFAVINGFGRVGVDKRQMAVGSFLILSGSLVLVVWAQGLVALGLLHMSVYAIVLVIARRAESQLVGSALNTTTSFAVPIQLSRAEVIKMYLISIGGFLTMSIDVLIANKIVSGPVFVEYGVVSRFALALIAIASFYVQIHFPHLSALARSRRLAEFNFSVVRIQWVVTAGSAVGALFVIAAYPLLIEMVMGVPSVLSYEVISFLMVFAVLCVNVIAVGQGIIAMGDSYLVHIALPVAVCGFICAIVAANVWGLVGIPAGLSFVLVISAILHQWLYRNRFLRVAQPGFVSHA